MPKSANFGLIRPIATHNWVKMGQDMREKDYLAGEFTAADIMMGYALRSYQRLLPDEALPANARAYWDRLTARDAYRAAIAAESPE